MRPAPPPVVEERYVAPAADPNLILARLEDSVASLRTWLAIVGLLAVAALGVALYTLLSDDGSGGSRSGLATDESVSRTNDRIDRLKNQVQSLRSNSAAQGGEEEAVGVRVAKLEQSVKTLAERPVTDAQPAVEELSGRIDDLASDVEALKKAAAAPAP